MEKIQNELSQGNKVSANCPDCAKRVDFVGDNVMMSVDGVDNVPGTQCPNCKNCFDCIDGYRIIHEFNVGQ